jgi:hypothetical protein
MLLLVCVGFEAVGESEGELYQRRCRVCGRLLAQDFVSFLLPSCCSPKPIHHTRCQSVTVKIGFSHGFSIKRPAAPLLELGATASGECLSATTLREFALR